MGRGVHDVNPRDWLAKIFSSRAAADGAVVRRSAKDVDTITGRARFLRELDRRGFQAFENAGQIVIFCNREPIRVLTQRQAVRRLGSNSAKPQIRDHEFANSS